MDFYQLIMECDANGVGDALDGRLWSENRPVAVYFKQKYGYGFHTSVSLLRTGTMPGYDKKLIREIVAEINQALGWNKNFTFVSGSASSNIQKHYGIDFKKLPFVIKAIRPKRTQKGAQAPKKIYSNNKHHDSSICIECYREYKIDIVSHPANLCICTECAPNGVCYGESKGSHGIHRTGRLSAV